MKVSNIIFASNVYVLREDNKIADKNFLSHVVDPYALSELVDKKRFGIGILPPLQREIYNNAKGCAYALTIDGVKDYTHGTIVENGKHILVNTCENADCPYFYKCSSLPDYRKIERTEKPSLPDEPPIIIKPDGLKGAVIEFAENFSVEKVRGLTFKAFVPTSVQKEFNEIIHSHDEKSWGVRGHWRHLWDGTLTYVRPHIRHHEEGESSYIFSQSTSQIIKTGLSKRQLKQIKKKFIERYPAQRIQDILSDKLSSYQLKNTIYIDDAKPIIESPIDSKILVNAGPGTGKTHAVIERLKYIIANMGDTVDLESILILCFSRSAVKVIRDRLKQAMKNGEIPYSGKKLTISTFDSFATWYIMQVDKDCDLSGLDYDERIAKFMRKFNDDSSVLNQSLSYLIIDEIQDLVGIRAKLVKTLLNKLTCGFLLLGDECQSIYDYQIKSQDELNAVKLYKWLEEHFGDNMTEYELTRNRRNAGKLGDDLKPLRTSLLKYTFPAQKKELKKVFATYGNGGMKMDEMLKCCDDGSVAILSWSNGDAYRQSEELYSREDLKITHTLLSGSRRVIFRRELADILSDYQYKTITKDAFTNRGLNAHIERNLIEDMWEGMLYCLDKDEDEDSLDLVQLRRDLLKEKRIDENLMLNEDADVTISTIHKAKGKEYDTVFLNRSGGVCKSEDVKVFYVALTRAKRDLVVNQTTSRSLDYKTESGRYVEFTKGYNSKIKSIELGIDGDIDPIGFVDETLSDLSVVERQKYIADCIRAGDPITIFKSKNKYLIVHKGYIIGNMNSEAFCDIRRYYHSGKSYPYSLASFTEFNGLYVKDVVTIVNKRLDERIAEPYDKSGFWYGIEFFGYAKPKGE